MSIRVCQYYIYESTINQYSIGSIITKSRVREFFSILIFADEHIKLPHKKEQQLKIFNECYALYQGRKLKCTYRRKNISKQSHPHKSTPPSSRFSRKVKCFWDK